MTKRIHSIQFAIPVQFESRPVTSYRPKGAEFRTWEVKEEGDSLYFASTALGRAIRVPLQLCVVQYVLEKAEAKPAAKGRGRK